MADGTEKLPRGIRNKNPGNIKLGTNWDGLAAEQTDPTFCIFDEAVTVSYTHLTLPTIE